VNEALFEETYDVRPDDLPTSPLASRRAFLQAAGAASAAAVAIASAPPKAFELNETTIAEMQQAMTAGKWTARLIAECYLSRIEEIDRRGPSLRSVIEVNPDAVAIAEALDDERKKNGPRGPLHGIPILVKDNIDSADRMATRLAGARRLKTTEGFVRRRTAAKGGSRPAR
jgi:hypothetical protein